MSETLTDQKLFDFYDKAYKFSVENYKKDIDWITNLKQSNITDDIFFSEYVWVVLCSGFSVKGAQAISDKLRENFDLKVIKHPLKRKAIEIGWNNYKIWWKHIKNLKTDEVKLEFLDTLPHIGGITKYHLGKNIGLNVAKPDVHLTRLADKYGFADVQFMCDTIGNHVGHERRLVDQILWRYCQIHPNYLNEMRNEVK